MALDIKRIRAAIDAHRGGLTGATDQQIKIIWDSLDDETRHQYLQHTRKLKPGETHAPDL